MNFNIKTLLINVFLFSIIFSNELHIGDKIYKLENNHWYNYSSGKKGDQMIMNRMIVRKPDKTTLSEIDFLEIGISNITIKSTPFFGGYYLIEIDEGENPIDVATSIHESNTFDYIEFDAVCEYFNTPNDEFYISQWGLHQDKLKLESAWEITTGDSNITVAIIDSGVDYNHPDLLGNLWENLGEDIDGDGLVYEVINGVLQFDPDDINGIDDDENGFSDDFIGWDFRDNEETIPNNEPMDELGHGTMVSGIISAKSNNINGIAGIAGGWGNIKQGIKVMPLRRNNQSPFELVSSSLDCINYAVNNNAEIINMSWGWGNHYDYVEETINFASLDSNCVLVAASGNLGADSIAYPAIYENVLAVGASDTLDNWLSFSNYGPELSVVAPGTFITTTTLNNGYTNSFSQTSAAVPHVSGLAALILSINPNLSSLQVKQLIENNADKVSGMQGDNFNPKYGYGRINVFNTLVSLFDIGDVNLNFQIELNDILLVVDYILNEMPFNDAQFFLADTNDDDLINITDVLALIYIILENDSIVNSSTISYLSGTIESIENGERYKYRIDMLNEQDVYILHFKLQFNNKIPLNVVKGSRSNDMTVSHVYKEDDYTINIMVYSPEGRKIPSGYGTILEIELESTGLSRDGELTDGSEFIVTDLANNPETLIPVEIVSADELSRLADEKLNQLIPDKFALYSVYPNPFNPTTMIKYDIPEESHISIKVFDLSGRSIETLVNTNQSPGTYSLEWNAEHLPTGAYFIKLETKEFTQTQKVMLVK